MTIEKVLIVGSGSQARYIIDIFHKRKNIKVVGLVDVESATNVGKKINDIPIVCFIHQISTKFKPAQGKLIIGYGQSKRKKEIADNLAAKGYQFISAVSQFAVVSPHATIGNGCIVNAGAVIMANASISNHVILHSGCVIEHDNVIGDFANLAPGVVTAGRVHIDEGATLYTGVRVIPDIKIGSWSTVLAGGLVTKDIPADAVYGGAPARSIPNSPGSLN